MNKADNSQEKYTTEVTPSGLCVRTEVATGIKWSWFVRPPKVKPMFTAKNNVTLKILEDAGHNVRVKHFRWALYLGHNERLSNHQRHTLRPIVVPAIFRKDPMYTLLPKGGYTHISIKTALGYICVSSECAEEDPFCYQLGVVKALERLTVTELRLLGLVV